MPKIKAKTKSTGQPYPQVSWLVLPKQGEYLVIRKCMKWQHSHKLSMRPGMCEDADKWEEQINKYGYSFGSSQLESAIRAWSEGMQEKKLSFELRFVYPTSLKSVPIIPMIPRMAISVFPHLERANWQTLCKCATSFSNMIQIGLFWFHSGGSGALRCFL